MHYKRQVVEHYTRYEKMVGRITEKKSRILRYGREEGCFLDHPTSHSENFGDQHEL